MELTKATHPECPACGKITRHNHWGRGPFKYLRSVSVRQCVNKDCKKYNSVLLWYPFRGWLHFNVAWREK